MGRSASMWLRTVSLLVALAAQVQALNAVVAAEINFGGNGHGLTGQPAGQAVAGPWQMSLVANPVGAVFYENGAVSVGVDSRGVPGAVDAGALAGIDKLNLLGGAPGLAGTPESMTFSFNRAGAIGSLRFDGVKDETLEYFSLTLPGGDVLTFFDFEVPLRLAQQGFDLAALNVANAVFLDDAEDDKGGLHLPFQAGQIFTLAYGEVPFPSGYVPRQNDAGNGARWQGLVIVAEPATTTLALMGATAMAALRQTIRRAASRSLNRRTCRI